MEVSTDPYPSFDFATQCPDDFHKNIMKGNANTSPTSSKKNSPSKRQKKSGKRQPVEEEEDDGLKTKEEEEQNDKMLLRGQEASAMISYFTTVGTALLEYLYRNDGEGAPVKNIEYTLDFGKYLSVLSKDSFISKAYWSSAKNEVLLNFRCLNVPVSESSSQSMNVILQVKNQEISRVFVSESQVSAVEQFGDQKEILVVGTTDGSLLLFNGSESDFQHKNSSNISEKHLNALWGSDKMTENLPAIRFCSYSSDFSFESHSSAVVSILADGNQIFSLEEMGVLTAWSCTTLPLDVLISGSFVKLTKSFSITVSGDSHFGSIERSFFSLVTKSTPDP